MDRKLSILKVKAFAEKPDVIKEPTMGEMADLVVLVLEAVSEIEETIKAGRLDGKTPEADKDYLSIDSAKRLLTTEINRMLSQTDSVLSQTSTELERRVQQALQSIRDGKDGIVSDKEIQRAAELAQALIELPDFDALVEKSLTENATATRDGLESIVNEDDKLKIEAVGHLRKELDELRKLVGNTSSGGITRGGVLQLIAENGSGISDGDKGDITVSASGTVWSIDADTIGQSELATTGVPNGSKFLRDDMEWTAIPGGGDALVANPLSQFAATTSLQLKGVISDETGSGALVFADTPTLVTPVLGAATATSINGATITSGTLNGSVTGTNTGDQTSIVGITGTKAQFDTAVSDGNILYVGDVTQYTDELAQDAVGAMVATSIVYNDAGATLQRAALTGAITAAQDSNATVLGSFTLAALNTAVSDANIIPEAGGTFTGDISVPDEAYDATAWNGSLEVPTKNAIRDKIESIAGVAGTLNVNTAAVGNVTTGEDDLITYSVTGNTLSTNGDYLTFEGAGTFANSINSKRIKVKFGATTIFDSTALAITTANDWRIHGTIVRTGSSAFKVAVEFSSSSSVLTASADYQTGTDDLTTALTLKFTGEATATDDIIQSYMITRVNSTTTDALSGYFLTANIDDTPVNGETAAPISSNWAFDHEADTSTHGVTTIVGVSETQTLTNKRVTKRTGTTTSSATPTINTDNVDEYYITAQTVDITSFTTNLSGTPTLGQHLFISVIGTAARAITWGASFANGPVALPTTTVTTTQLSVFFKWDGTVWRCYASGSTV